MAATFHCIAAGEVDCEWHDIAKAYMEADTQSYYFARYPPGFARYMHLTGDKSFNPHHCLLRARKNVYGHPTSGRVWFDLYTHFLKHDVGLIQCPLDRCVFLLTRLISGVRAYVIAILYVDDILLLGHLSLRSLVRRKIYARFPTK